MRFECSFNAICLQLGSLRAVLDDVAHFFAPLVQFQHRFAALCGVLSAFAWRIEFILAVFDVVSWNFSGRASFWAHIPPSQPKNM